MDLDQLIQKAKISCTAEHGRYYVTYYNGTLTVYLDRRLLVQIQSGVVEAFQAYSKREAVLIQKVLNLVGLKEVYTMIPDSEIRIASYNNGILCRVQTSLEVIKCQNS